MTYVSKSDDAGAAWDQLDAAIEHGERLDAEVDRLREGIEALAGRLSMADSAEQLMQITDDLLTLAAPSALTTTPEATDAR